MRGKAKGFELGGENFMTLKEAAARLNISMATVRRRLLSDELKTIRIGGTRYVSEQELLRFLKEK